MKSSWEETKKRSKYHFDTDLIDPRWDCVQQLGHIENTWTTALQDAIEQSYPVTWRTRGQPDRARAGEEYDAEEYDLEKIGMGKDFIVTNINYDVPKVFNNIADKFALEDTMVRVHVQLPGQVWNLHLDKLEKWMPTDPSKVSRFFIQLTDWQPGHFWSYGNYMWSGWKAGNASTFDWINVPHSTANAGHVPRATLQITGVKTKKTDEFLQELSLTL